MAGTKRNATSKPRQQKPVPRKRSKTTGRAQTPRQRRSFPLKAIGRLVLVVGVVVVAFIVGPMLANAGAGLWQQLLSTFGLGLILLIAAIGVLIWLIVRGFGPLARRWNVFVGATLAAIALWGILGLIHPAGGIFWTVSLGGEVGQAIAGPSEMWGAVQSCALFVLALVFTVPQPLVRTTRWLFRPRPRKVKPIPLAGYNKPAVSTSSTRSVLAPESPVQAQEKTAPKSDDMSKAAVGVPKLELDRRGFHLGRKAQEQPAEVAAVSSPAPEPVLEVPVVPMREPLVTVGGWQIPPVDVLDRPTEVVLNQDEIDKRARAIEEALDSYGVESKVVQINTGPTVTQFGLEPGWVRKYKKVVDNGQERQEEVSRTRIRVDRITALSNDLALALAAPSIRIEAPIPGKSMVGIEVPNSAFGAVSLRSVIESTSFQKTQAKAKLALALGKGAGGESVAGDLAKMPHLLIAGATGSGKTVCLDSIICCLLMHNSPDDLRFLLVDPKRVELVSFSEIPHLAAPVVVDTEKAVKVLRWLSVEMDRRYREFAKAKARNIEAFNKDRLPGESMPYLVLVVDELADLMMAAFDEVEHSLCRLAQLARATGIHLIVATQRPSVDVVTGLIKANFPTRISFAVTSQVDSRTILDTVGAEKLLGRGDMLYLPSEAGRPKRLQGTYVADAEIERVVEFWAGQRRPEKPIVDLDELKDGAGQKIPVEDPMLEEARKLAADHQQISASFLQRKLRIGYPRAARIMEELEYELEKADQENPEESPTESPFHEG